MKQYGIWIGVLLGAAFLVWLLHCFVFSSYVILSSDMEDTLLPGERVIVNKWSYGLRLPCMSFLGYQRIGEEKIQKGDVVVFNNPLEIDKEIDRRSPLIYRCLAGPGDTISVDSCRLVVPSHGVSVEVTKANCTLLCNTLRLHEGRKATVRHDTLFINNCPVKRCVFYKDYYWMVSDRMPNITDSHLFGLVPQEHIIGKASIVWFSKDPNQNIFYGYRWKRFFHLIR